MEDPASVGGLRAIIEVRSEETAEGAVAEMVFLALFNERVTDLVVMYGEKSGVVASQGFVEILVSYSTGGESFELACVDTSVGRVTWDNSMFPPRVEIDQSHALGQR